MKRYGKYERHLSWIVKRFGNTEENCEMIWKKMDKSQVEMWNDMENMEENSEKI
jgi:hypothetical protein